MSLKDLGHTPRRTTVRIVLDDTLRQNVEDARAAYTAQQKAERAPDLGLVSTLAEYQERLDTAEAAAELAAVSFVFEAIPRRRLAELVEECPPTSEQLERWKEEDRNNPLIVIPAPEFDYVAFPPRLIAASLVEPETSEAEVVDMWENGDWSDAIWDQLWKTAWNGTNKQVTTLPTSGIGSRRTQTSDPVSPTP